MAITLDGAEVAELEYTQSWGVTPAAARFNCPGSVSVNVDDQVAIAFGGVVFYGRITNAVENTGRGVFTEISAADNRLLLHRDYVKCTFNNVEIIEDNPYTPGIDRTKRFWHIFPDDWATQKKTYSSAPMTASAILEKIRQAPGLSVAWTFEYHADQFEFPVFAIDANNGVKLANILHDISEKQGLLFTIAGFNTLVWARKGEGTLPTLPTNAYDIRSGEALSNNDTAVEVIGDRNRYQCDSVTLSPDWNAALQNFWLEADWISFVSGSFGLPGGTADAEAALFAKAKSVTLRELCEHLGPAYADFGLWGEVSRMEMPVWTYIEHVVFKAYAIPTTFHIGGSDWSSLELVEGLLLEMDFDASSGTLVKKLNGVAYPDTKALIIAQGQPVGLIDPKYHHALTPTQLASARTLWSSIPRFSFDPRNKVVIFEEAVFVPGTGDGGLFLFPNVGVDGTNMPENHPAYNLAVPNANVTISPAPVKATLVFDAERYSKAYGSGSRKGTHYCQGLRLDAFLVSGVFNEEVKYADGKTADEKSSDLAAGLILRQSSYASGGWKRPGAAGTPLNGVLDRVTVRINEHVGIEEEVEYTKERVPVNFFNERELDRQQRQKDLFPGQNQNREDVWALQELAQINAQVRRSKSPPMKSANDVMLSPTGAPQPGQQVVTDTGNELGVVSAGQAIALDSGTGKPVFTSTEGVTFGGIAIADGQNGRITVATQGIVPVIVKGPVSAGDVVGWVSGVTSCSTGGKDAPVGAVLCDYKGSSEVLLPVRLASTNTSEDPFQILKASPPAGSGDASTNWVQVSLNSWLLKDANPTSKITITGLGSPFQLNSGDRVWLHIDLTGIYTTGGLITASIDHGQQWGEGLGFFPIPVQYDTDDGTRLGSSGTPPSNRKQIGIFIPIGYVESAEDDSFGMIAAGFALALGNDEYIIQQLRDNLIMGETCVDGGSVQFALPAPFAPQPDAA